MATEKAKKEDVKKESVKEMSGEPINGVRKVEVVVPIPILSEYSVEELAENAAIIFEKGVWPECVIAALQSKGISKTTVDNAKSIIDDFMNREVM